MTRIEMCEEFTARYSRSDDPLYAIAMAILEVADAIDNNSSDFSDLAELPNIVKAIKERS